jgi:hypothetical protein
MRSTATDEVGSPARQLRRCTPESFPQQLPAAAALVDTASLTTAIRELRRGATADSGTVLLSLGFERDGINIRRDVLRHTLSPVVADSIQKLVFAHRRTAPASEQPWGARLRIGLGGAVSYTVERREHCPPRPRDRELESAAEQFMGTGLSSRGGRLERTVLLRVLVHPGGYVADAKIVRGEASGGTLERNLTDFIRRYLFEPASLDGVPVYGHVDVPVRVRV